MKIALLMQALGALLVAFGLWMLAPWLGMAVFGLLVLIGGVVLEMEGKNGSG
jgi:hypothetical protein